MSAAVSKSLPVSFFKSPPGDQTMAAIFIAGIVCTLGSQLIDMIDRQDAIHVKLSVGDFNFEVDKEKQN